MKYMVHKVVNGILNITLFIPSDYEVAFDWDDCLADSREQFLNCITKSQRIYGTPANYREFEAEVPTRLPNASRAILSVIKKDVHVVSNKTTKYVMREINEFGLMGRFKSIRGDSDKPNDISVLTSIGKKGILFGDNSRNDGLIALKAGWDFVRMDASLFLFEDVRVRVVESLSKEELDRMMSSVYY